MNYPNLPYRNKRYAATSDEKAAIVNPVVSKRSPNLGPLGLMVSPEADFYCFREQLNRPAKKYSKLYLSRLYHSEIASGPTLVGPMIGAPYAAMVLESLIAWGCRQVIFFGWCGSIDPEVNIGDIIIPTEAFIDEGTSPQYQCGSLSSVQPSKVLKDTLEKTFNNAGANIRKGPIWTTDGVFRETPKKVHHYQKQNVIGVEMELSALLTVGAFRKIDVAGLLVVSDELHTMTWHPGFKSSKFKKGRAAAIKGLLACLKSLPDL